MLIRMEAVLKALEAIHSPNANAALRDEANAFCQKVESDRDRCLEVGTSLLQQALGRDGVRQEMQDVTLHFALSLLDHCARFHFANLSMPQRGTLRDVSIQLMGASVFFASRPRYLREKVASCVAEVGRRESPHIFLQQTIQSEKADPQKIDMIMLILRYFAERLNGAEGQRMPLPSRSSSLDAIGSNVELIFSLLRDVLCHCLQAANDDTMISLAKTTLEASAEFVEFAPHDVLFKSGFPGYCCAALRFQKLQMDALVNLECILSRKGGGREERASLFLFDYFPSIVCALQEDLASETSGETLFFRRQMAELLVHHGKKHMDVAFRHQDPDNYEKFLQVMLHFMSQPDIVITRSVITFWKQLIQNYSMRKHAAYSVAVTALIPAAIPKAVMPDMEKYDDEQYLAELGLSGGDDFLTLEEFKKFFLAFHHDVVTLLQKLAECESAKTVSFLAGVFKTVGNLPLLQLRTLDAVVQAVMPRIPKSELESNADVRQATEEILRAVVAMNPQPQSQEAIVRLSMLRNSTHCLQRGIDCSYIFKESKRLLFIQGDSEAISSLRRRALDTLVAVCETIPEEGTFQELLGLYREMSAKNVLSQSELSVLLRGMVSVGYHLPSPSSLREGLFEHVLSSLQRRWERPELQSVLLSPPPALSSFTTKPALSSVLSPLLQCSGVGLGDGVGNMELKDEIYHILEALVATAKPYRPANMAKDQDIAYHFPPLFAKGILSMLLSLNSLFHHSVEAALPPQWKILLQPEASILRNLMGDDFAAERNRKDPVERLSLWLSRLRHFAHSLVARMAQFESFFSLPSFCVTEAVAECCFRYFPALPDRHCREIIRKNKQGQVISPITAHCPEEVRGQLVRTLLRPFLQSIFQRLHKRWSEVAGRVYSDKKGGSLEERQRERNEIVEDKFLLNLSKSFFEWLRVLYPTPKTPPAKDSLLVITLQCEEALQSLFFTLAFALGSRQPQLLSLVLSTASAVALVGIFLEIDSLANLCSGELVKALLMAYSSNADSRDFQTIARLLRDVLIRRGETESTVSVLLSLPSSSREKVQGLFSALRTETEEKAQIRVVCDFLDSFSQVHMTGGARGMLKLSFPTHLHPAPSAARLSYSVERRAQLNDKDTDDSPVVSQLWR